ncbi:MAG: hypothetical protein EOP48_22005 [Sphingobacteriales bacterium]|nr:MAG: hypothetical protein EOP48_22005 [Sphingobacteriales bacterium]
MTAINNTTLGLCFLLGLITSCNQLVEVPESKNQIETSIVFADSSLAASALLGAYFTLGTTVHSAINKNINTYSDEYAYTASAAAILEFNKSQLSITNGTNAALWNGLFSTIYQVFLPQCVLYMPNIEIHLFI